MLKKLLFFLIAIFLLAGIALGVLLFNLNPILEKFKPEINAKISDVLGQKSSIGETSLQLFPEAGVAVKDISIGEGTERSFIKKAVLHSGVKKLFKGEISISKLSLEGGEIKLKKESDGSIEIAGVSLKKEEQKVEQNAEGNSQAQANIEETSLKSDAPTSDSGLKLELKDAELKDITVFFQDKSASPAQNLQFDNLSAKLSDFTTSPSGRLKGNLSFIGKEKNNIGVSANIDPNTPFSVSDLDLNISSLDLGRISKILAAYGIRPSGLNLSKELKAKASANFSDKSSGKLNLELDAAGSDISFAKNFKKVSGENLKLSLSADYKKNDNEKETVNNVNFNNINLNLGQSLINSSLTLENKATKNSSGESKSNNKIDNIKVSSKNLMLEEVSKFLPSIQNYGLKGESEFSLSVNPKPLNIKGPGELKNLSVQVPYGAKKISVSEINSKLNFKGNSLSLEDTSLNLASQKIKADLDIEDFSKPKVTFNINSDKLNLETLGAELGLNPKSFAGAFLGNLKSKGNYDVNQKSGKVSLEVEEAEISKIPLKSVNIKSEISPQKIKILPSSIKSFGGSLDFFANISQTGAKALDLSIKGNNFDSAIISKTFMPDSKFFLTGIIKSVTSNVSSTMGNFLPQSSGSLKVKVDKGTIEGINIFGESLAGVTGIPGLGSRLSKYVPEEHQSILELEHTPFDSLTFDSNLDNGRLNIRSFSLEHSIYALDGDGYVGVTDDSKMIRARLSLSKLLAQKMIERHSKLRHIENSDGGIVIPVLIKQNPGGRLIVTPDVKDLLKRAGRNTAKRAIAKELEKVTPGLGKAAEALDGLFGGKKRRTESPPSGENVLSDNERNEDTQELEEIQDDTRSMKPKDQLEKALGDAAGKALEGLFN